MNIFKRFFRNIDLRKFFGTIIGGAFFLCCVAYFTYAYYEWKSDETSIALTIHEADVKCTLGPDVNVFNIGPVLNLSDGVKSSFAIENSFTEDMAISVILDITSISDSLLNESFKWAIVQENESNFDYDNPIIEGSFKNFRKCSNLVTTALQVPSQQTVNYEFVIYIDGNMKNDISMMKNSMEASLTLGNCGTDYIRYDELTQFAFYSADDNSLTFTYDYPREIGSTYLGKTVTNLYTGYDTAKYNKASAVPWYSDGNYDDITSVVFLEPTTPTSTAFWFNGFSNTQNMNLEKLDTSNVTTMASMFQNCSNILELDVKSFDVTNVSGFGAMFSGCNKLETLDLNGWDTSNVTNMLYMFSGCSSLISLDLSSFDTSVVTGTGMEFMFDGCSSLRELDLRNFDTSQLTSLKQMFYCCSNLTKLDVSNWDTSNVGSMASMFYNCNSLTNLYLFEIKPTSGLNTQEMFRFCSNLITEIKVLNNNISNYNRMFESAVFAEGASVKLYYIEDDPTTSDVNESTYDLVEAMIAQKSHNSNVINGGCIGDYCTNV